MRAIVAYAAKDLKIEETLTPVLGPRGHSGRQPHSAEFVDPTCTIIITAASARSGFASR